MSRVRATFIKPPNAIDLRKIRPSDVRRFLAMVDAPTASGCWPWLGHKDENGYGQFRFGRKVLWAHRFVHALFHGGTIPMAREIDHKFSRRKCIGPSCVCPWHTRKLRPMVNATNGGNGVYEDTIPGGI